MKLCPPGQDYKYTGIFISANLSIHVQRIFMPSINAFRPAVNKKNVLVTPLFEQT